MITGFIIALVMTVLTVIAMGMDMHDMQSQIKQNMDDIKGMNEFIHGRKN